MNSRVYEAFELEALTLAFAITIHKSQGSEFLAVVVPVLNSHHIMLQRNLLYTAITRARRLVVLVGDPKAIAVAVLNDKVLRRYTALATRLVDSTGASCRFATLSRRPGKERSRQRLVIRNHQRSRPSPATVPPYGCKGAESRCLNT